MDNPDIYKSNNCLIFDFETTNLDKGSAKNPNNRIILTVVSDLSGKKQYKWGNEFEIATWLDRKIKEADYIVAHNAKFELSWLERCGIELHTLPPVWCTQIGEYVLLSNRCRGLQELSLDKSCKRRGLPQKESLVSFLIDAGVCPSEIPENLLLSYCIQDFASQEV